MRAPLENLMGRGSDTPEMITIDAIIAHDGTVTAIAEGEMNGGNETIDETELGEMVTGIVIVDMRIAEGVFRMPTTDTIVLPSLPVIYPMVHHVYEGHPTRTGKRASEYHFLRLRSVLTCIYLGYLLTHYVTHPHYLQTCVLP